MHDGEEIAAVPVFAGQTSRSYVEGGYETVEAAKAAFPDAVPSGCGYQAPCLSHLPDADGPDPFGDNADAASDSG